MDDIKRAIIKFTESVKKHIDLYSNFWTSKTPTAVYQSPPKNNNIKYSLDENQFRIYPKLKVEGNKKLFCFGCEATFGDGLNDEETWPYILAQKMGKDYVPKNYGVPECSLEYNTMCFYQLVNSLSKENYPTAAFFFISDPYRAFYIGNDDGDSPLISHINLSSDRNCLGEIDQKRKNYYAYTSAVYTFFKTVKHLKFIDQIAKNRNIPWFWSSTNPFFQTISKDVFMHNLRVDNFIIHQEKSSSLETNREISERFKQLYERHSFRTV